MISFVFCVELSTIWVTDVINKGTYSATGGVTESAAGNMADKPGNQEEDVEMTDKESADAEPKGLLTTGSTQSKKRKKRVSWVEDINLRQIFYFELDETERGKHKFCCS